MPTLTIDGREVTVEPGATVLQAAEQLGIDIPTFCYHPGLSIPANCRMCLVESNKAGKPIPACHTHCGDGMEISTSSDEVVLARKQVLEFILLNHPVDCPICDQAGECVLQDHYFRFSAQASRLGHVKVQKDKAKVLGPNVILDAERCIMCTRCIRFCDEIAGSSQLTMTHRGEHTEITTFPGEELDNPYATNVVDICPVGALTSREFRFRSRVWFMQSAESVCPSCSRGCKIRVDTFENVARRYRPLYNPQVNDWWMCDAGRASFRGDQEGRMEGPRARVDGEMRVVPLPEAYDAAIRDIQASAGSDRLTVIVTPWFTNEDALLVGRLLAGPLAGARVYVGGRADGDGDDVLVRADKNPNRYGLTRVFSALGVATEPLGSFSGEDTDAAVVFGDRHALTDAQFKALSGLEACVVAASYEGPLWELASTFLPTRIHLEKSGTFTNFDGVVQRIERALIPTGTCKSEGWYAMKLSDGLGAPMSYSGPADVFSDLVSTVDGFQGIDPAALLPHGAKLGHGQTGATT